MISNTDVTDKPQSKRDVMIERLKVKYPEKDFIDDETLFSQINDDYDEYDEKDRTIDGYRERESALVDIFTKDPHSAQFITDMARGEDPFANIIRRIGIDGMTDLINDPDKQAAFAEANKEYLAQVAKSKELDDEYKRNIAESLSQLDRIQRERGLTDEQIDAAMDLLGKIAQEAIVGVYSEQSIDMALKALYHDIDVEAATAEGEVRGRNAKIEERLRRPQQGDGQPTLAGANNAPKQKISQGSILDLASQA